ncbi:hypothetical protein BS50DRAFT_269264 [Corynespora cassiicola Philippines]|uniref:Uncharacterized protein n=1 Tax=Corynespora cassiicola Philippines TaxID=1448308 RepID=A0A2T2P0L6_CORCC|nr:hypothetical protein BS50DRAFT_269264 [Corynespora cassiicola Philippines]
MLLPCFTRVPNALCTCRRPGAHPVDRSLLHERRPADLLVCHRIFVSATLPVPSCVAHWPPIGPLVVAWWMTPEAAAATRSLFGASRRTSRLALLSMHPRRGTFHSPILDSAHPHHQTTVPPGPYSPSSNVSPNPTAMLGPFLFSPKKLILSWAQRGIMEGDFPHTERAGLGPPLGPRNTQRATRPHARTPTQSPS